MEKAISAFRLDSLFDAPGITAIASYGDELLAGTDQGGLLVASKAVRKSETGSSPAGSPSSPDRGGAEPARWAFRSHRRIFGTGAVRQLDIAHTPPMLLSLDSEGVNAYHLPNFVRKGQAHGTSKSSCFDWDDASGLLCTAYKKRLSFFLYDGLEFSPQKEAHLPHAARAVAIVGGTVYVALDSEYVMVDAASRAVTPLFPAGDGAHACLVKVSPTDVLLLRNGSGIFLGPEGRTTRRGAQVPWSCVPSSVSVSRPYAVARVAAGFEVRPLEPLSASPLVQRLDVDEKVELVCSHSTRDGSLPLTLKGADGTAQLAVLEPLPFAEQAGRLLNEGEYEEALAVAGLVPSDDPDIAALKDRIHAEYGRALFGRGEYNDALLHFSMDRRSDPLRLLSLLPSLSPAGLLEESLARVGEPLPPGPEPSGDAFCTAVATMLPYLLSARSRVASAVAGEQGPEAAFSPSSATPVAVLLDMAILKALLIMPDSGALLQFIERPNCIDFELGARALREAGRYSELVALCQSQGRHDEALDLLEALSQRPESLEVPPQGAAADLRGFPGAWAAVKYITKLGPTDAGLITAHAKWILEVDPEAGLQMFTAPGTNMTPDVVLPILEAHAAALAGTEADRAGIYHERGQLAVCGRVRWQVVRGPYLESALARGVAAPERYEQVLAKLYLHELEAGTAPPATEGKLRQLIRAGKHLDCVELLDRVPRDTLFQVQIALLERLGRHLDALHIFIHTLKRPDEAEAYCDRIYSEQQKQRRAEAKASPASKLAVRSDVAADWFLDAQGNGEEQSFNIYLLLIQALLDERDDSGTGFRRVARRADDRRWVDVAKLLSRKRNVIHPLRALELLPGDIPLHRALPFLEGAVLGMQERMRATAMRRSLVSAEHVRVHSELLALEARSIRITPERACSLCYRRIGTTAFVAFPSGMLAHFSCYRKMGSTSELDEH